MHVLEEIINSPEPLVLIGNSSESDDRLIAVEADFASTLQLHTHIMENDIAKMREVEGGFEIAAGTSRALIERTADVCIKERRPVILVVRETPFSVIHLENMLKLARAGVVVMPANPGYYHRPEAVEDLVDYMVARVLDHLGIEHALMPRWGEERRENASRSETMRR